MSYNNNLDPPRTNSTTTLSTSASSSSSSQVKVYQFFMFCVPIFFTFLLLFLFYFFYLRPRRLNWSSLRMPTSSTLNFHHFLPTVGIISKIYYYFNLLSFLYLHNLNVNTQWLVGFVKTI